MKLFKDLMDEDILWSGKPYKFAFTKDFLDVRAGCLSIIIITIPMIIFGVIFLVIPFYNGIISFIFFIICIPWILISFYHLINVYKNPYYPEVSFHIINEKIFIVSPFPLRSFHERMRFFKGIILEYSVFEFNFEDHVACIKNSKINEIKIQKERERFDVEFLNSSRSKLFRFVQLEFGDIEELLKIITSTFLMVKSIADETHIIYERK